MTVVNMTVRLFPRRLLDTNSDVSRKSVAEMASLRTLKSTVLRIVKKIVDRKEL